ncbi:MAG: hypothetical protein R6U88_05195 [Candidatus Bipolaricaulota bacterium]
MANRPLLSVYFSRDKVALRPVERLARLAQERERSVNWLVVEAIVQYLDKEDDGDRPQS